MASEIYIPMSKRAARDLERLVELTGLSERQIIGMAFTNLLAGLREFDNENFPVEFPLSPVATHSGESEPAGPRGI